MDELNELLKKQAQDFVLTPSPSVWLNVEADIVRRERKRRWLMLFFFLTLLLSGTIILYHLFAKNRPGENHESSSGRHTPVIKKNAGTSQPVAGSITETQAQKTTGNNDKMPVAAKWPTRPAAATQPAHQEMHASVPAQTPVAVLQAQPAKALDMSRALPPYVLKKINRGTIVPALIRKEGDPDLQGLKPAAGGILPAGGARRSSPSVVIYPLLNITPIRQEPAAEELLPMALLKTLKGGRLSGTNGQALSPVAAKAGSMSPEKISSPAAAADERALPVLAVGTIKRRTDSHSTQPIPAGKPVITPQMIETLPVLPRHDMPASRSILTGEPEISRQPAPSIAQTSWTAAGVQPDSGLSAAGTTGDIPVPLPGPISFPAPDTLPVSRKKDSKWRFALSLAPAINSGRISETGDSLIIKRSRNATSKNMLRLNYSARISYQVLPYLQVYSGLGIRSLGEQMRRLQVIPSVDTLAISSPGNGVVIRPRRVGIDNDSAGFVNNKYTYLEMPLGLHVRLLHYRRWSIGLQADIAVSRLVRSAGYYFDYGERKYQAITNDRLKSWLLSYGGGISLSYDINRHAGIELAPYYRVFPSSVYNMPAVSGFRPASNTAYQFHQYFEQAGIAISFRYTP